MVMGATASAQYLLDAHRDIAIETFTCLIIFKNLLSFVLTLLCLSVGSGQGVSENVCHLREYRGRNLFVGYSHVCVWEEE
jgi:hypothetical protein